MACYFKCIAPRGYPGAGGYTLRFQILYGCSCQHLYGDGESILIDIEAWMVVRIFCSFFLVVRAYDEVAAGDGVEEIGHIIAARRQDLFAFIYILLAHRFDSGLAHHFGHGGIVYTWWAAPQKLPRPCAPHGQRENRGHPPPAAHPLFSM